MTNTDCYLIQFFVFVHLREDLKPASLPFVPVAAAINAHENIAGALGTLSGKLLELPDNPQRVRMFAKLSELERSHSPDGDAPGPLGREHSLHLLLEAKDCAVRALLYKEPGT